MKIILDGEDAIVLEGGPAALTIEAETAHQIYSPFHMVASGLATCTYSVLQSWADHAKLDLAGLRIHVSWTFAEDPHRVGAMTVKVEWPGLPAERMKAAERVAERCAVHQSLTHPPEINIELAA